MVSCVAGVMVRSGPADTGEAGERARLGDTGVTGVRGTDSPASSRVSLSPCRRMSLFACSTPSITICRQASCNDACRSKFCDMI